MASAFSDARPEHLLIRALGEDRAARQSDTVALRHAHEALARNYRERAAKLGLRLIRAY